MALDVGGARGKRADLGRWPLVGRTNELVVLQQSIADERGAVITGPVGVGKSTLAMAGVQYARDQGLAVTLVSGTEAARAYPFGAFASLLPHGVEVSSGGPESHAEALRYYTRELVHEAGGRPLLVFVDDAHLLDDGSAMLVHQLSQTRTATVLACVLQSGRAGLPTADPMVVLWKDQQAERIALEVLEDGAIEELLTTVLGGPVERASVRQVCERSLGDPVFLRELVAGALEAEVLREENGIWRLRGSLEPTPRLAELVNLRLGALSDGERHVLELTAMGEPLAQPTLDELTEPGAVEALEDKALITSRMDGRRLQICLAHPVIGDVVRAGISPRRERVLARALAESTGGRRQEDTLLLASLRLVGGGGSKELLLAGAEAARQRRDIALSEKMARAAIDSGAGFDARYLAADAAHVRGRREQAELELAALAADAQTSSERVRVALLRFDHAFSLKGAADLSDIDALLSVVDEPRWRDELVARRLMLCGLKQGPRAVLDLVSTPLLRSADAPRTALDPVVGRALSRAGRLHEATGLLQTATDNVLGRAGAAFAEPWSPFGAHTLALVGLGWLSEAEELLMAAQGELATVAGAPEHAVVSFALGALRLEQGRVQGAFLHASSAAGMFLDLGLPVAARPAYALAASALALAGQPAKAAETLEELDALVLPADMQDEVEVMQARAWTSAAANDMATAREHLEVAVETGHETGDRLGTTRALHGLARMGRARQVADQLELLAAHVDGPFTEARLSYTLAAAAKDSAALEDAADAFEDVGAMLYAAEALGEAAVHYRRDGSTRDAAAAQHKAARLLARCEGGVTPFVQAIGARAQLTPAELDTALKAAHGSTDKQIAELMHLSVRTVENRLHRAYQKLGLSHRRELADALRDMPGA
jgi:DNA-binding CsgD family transcriptional regulator